MVKNHRKIAQWKGTPSRQEVEKIKDILAGVQNRGENLDATYVDSLTREIQSLPQHSAREIFREFAKERGEDAIPMLRSMAESGDVQVANLAIEGLGLIASAKAANILSEIAYDGTGKEVRKEAKKSLHRLKNLGIVPVELKKPAPAKAFMPKAHNQLLKAYSTVVDGAGSRALWFVVDRPAEGQVVLVMILNDLVGIKRVAAYELNKRRLQEELARMRDEEDIQLVDIPVDYAQYLAQEAYQKSLEIGTLVPAEFLLFREVLTPSPGTHFVRSVVYRELDAAEIEAAPGLLDRSPMLLRKKEFASWFLEFEEVQKYVLEYLEAHQSRIVISPEAKEDRLRVILYRAIDELFPEERRALFCRRLEEQAHILFQTGQVEEAKMALAAALELGEDLPSHTQPLLQALMMKSMAIAVEVHIGGPVPDELEMMSFDTGNEPEPEKKSPGGLILPY